MTITIAAVGDVLIDRDDPSTAFAKVHDALAAADLRFGNCEAVYSTTEERIIGGAGKFLSPPAGVAALQAVGFDVMSCANNHVMDGGYSGMRDTLAGLDAAGIATTGAGENLAAARTPAIVEADGVKVGVLAYTCVFPPGVEAAGSRPGMATLEVHTVYRGETGQPGTRPKIQTFVDVHALASVRADIEALRPKVDVVMVSVHMGIHMLPAELADYEIELARAAVDAGADVVLGHHQHILKGVELYRGKPIYYGLGNFVIDLGHGGRGHVANRHPYGDFYAEYEPRPRGESGFPFHDESRWTLIARIRVDRSGVLEAALLPCWIEEDWSPRVVQAGTAEFVAFRDYVADISSRAGLAVELTTRGDEIVIAAPTT